MPDYNIYIHAISDNSQNSPTTPWSNRGGTGASGGNNGDGDKNKSNPIGAFSRAVNTLVNPDSLVAQGLSVLQKALPPIAAAFVVVSASEKLASLQCNYLANINGDYRYAHAWNNYQATKNLLFSPVSTIAGAYMESRMRDVEDERRRIQATLLGDSVINSYYGKGV